MLFPSGFIIYRSRKFSHSIIIFQFQTCSFSTTLYFKVFKRVTYSPSLYLSPLFIFNKWIIVLALCCLLFFTLFSSLCALRSTRRYLSAKTAWEWRWRKGAQDLRARVRGRKKRLREMLFLKNLKIIHYNLEKSLKVREHRSTIWSQINNFGYLLLFQRICKNLADIITTHFSTNSWSFTFYLNRLQWWDTMVTYNSISYLAFLVILQSTQG